MFQDIKQYSFSPMHMTMRYNKKSNFSVHYIASFLRVFESTWKAAVDLQVPTTECTRLGKPCTLHPHLAPPKEKGVRAAACDAKEIVTRDFQQKFKARLGIRAFFPEPIKGGNSNTGNVARRFFKAAATSADILGIPEELISTLWELLTAINSSKFQDIEKFESKAKVAFYLWRQVFSKTMTANLHMLLVHGSLYLRWAQEEVGLALGTLTEGSIEVANKDVKAANKKFVTRVSAERVHQDILTRRSWEADPLLHFEMTQHQAIQKIPSIFHSFISLRRLK